MKYLLIATILTTLSIAQANNGTGSMGSGVGTQPNSGTNMNSGNTSDLGNGTSQRMRKGDTPVNPSRDMESRSIRSDRDTGTPKMKRHQEEINRPTDPRY